MTKGISNTADSMRKLVVILSLAGAALPLAGRALASESEAPKPEKAEATAAGIAFSFKLDPRLSRAQYMGDRWVAIPTYTINHAGTSATVDARAHVTDRTGEPVPVRPRWRPADPAMVTVTPDEGSDVTITVHRAGESRLRVTAGGASRELTVKAVQNKGAILVEIDQVPPAGTPEGEERARILGGKTERTGYALGVDFGRKLKQHLAEVDADSLKQGLADTLEGKTLLMEAELQTALVAFQGQLRARQMATDRAELAEKNRKDGEAFLARNAAREGVVTLESGLQYEVLRAGEGARPTVDDTIACHYRGTLIDGKEFDSSYERNEPTTFALKRVIKGWGEALQLMPVGSKWQLFIPPELAYGARGTLGIGPNATLVFEVELLSIENGSMVRQRPAAGDGVLARFRFAFKTDPSPSSDAIPAWVSPQSFSGTSGQDTVRVVAGGLDATGQPVRINPTWTAADPDMIEISPGEGNVVEIKVKRAGESTVAVTAGDISEILSIKAQDRAGVINLQITQAQH